MGLETIIFGKKTVSDVLKEVYDNSKNKEKQVNTLITELRTLISDVSDAVRVVPLIKEYLEIGVKNDEHLIKMLTVVQRMESGGKGEIGDLFNPEELAQLLEESSKPIEDKNDKEEEN